MKTRSGNLAIDFALWLYKSDWEILENDKFCNRPEGSMEGSDKYIGTDWTKTVEELFEIFKIQGRIDGNDY